MILQLESHRKTLSIFRLIQISGIVQGLNTAYVLFFLIVTFDSGTSQISHTQYSVNFAYCLQKILVVITHISNAKPSGKCPHVLQMPSPRAS